VPVKRQPLVQPFRNSSPMPPGRAEGKKRRERRGWPTCQDWSEEESLQGRRPSGPGVKGDLQHKGGSHGDSSEGAEPAVLHDGQP
jgi:hypothetical protein